MNEIITKNKIIELPCYIGDTVYYLQHPTNAAVWCKEKPVIVQMKVTKISYNATNNKGQIYEKIRIDTSYKNKLGDDCFTFFIFGDDEFYTTLKDAENRLESLIEV